MKIKRHAGTRGKVLTGLMNSINAKKSAEIGVFKGGFAKTLLRPTKTDLYLVDIWRKISKEEYDDTSNSSTSYAKCMEALEGYEDRAFMLRMSSEKAADMFPDGFFDFIFIDANHAYDYVKQDIELWYPKVRPGGILSGHDWVEYDWETDTQFEWCENKKDKIIYHYGHRSGVFGVNPAVTEFAEAHDYEVNLTSDKMFQSWFIVKDNDKKAW